MRLEHDGEEQGVPAVDPERLRRWYHDDGLTLRQIAERLNWYSIRSNRPRSAPSATD